MVMNFAVPTSPYEGLADSLIQGYSSGTQAKQNYLSFPEQLKQLQANTKLLETKAKFAEPNAEADLLKTQLGNQTNQIDLQTLSERNKAALAQALIANKTGQINLQTLPQKNQADLQKALLGNQEAQINLDTLPQKNQADIAETLARSKYYEMGGGKGGAISSDLSMLRSAIDRQYPDKTQDEKDAYLDAFISGRQTTPNGLPVPVPYGEVQAALDAILHHTNTAQGQNQIRFANTLDTLFQNADPVAEKAFKFAGMARDAKLGISALAAQRGVNDPDYLAYLQFTDQVIPSMVSEILRTGGSNSTDSQKLLAIQETNPIQRRNNPDLAMAQWKFLENTYKKLSKTIAQSPSQARASLLNGQGMVQTNNDYVPSVTPVNNYSMEDLQHTAQKYGVSVDEVKRRLGVK